jgi:hypothetical protein
MASFAPLMRVDGIFRIFPWDTKRALQRDPNDDTIPIPGSALELLEKHEWITADYKNLWRHKNGGSGVLMVGGRLGK